MDVDGIVESMLNGSVQMPPGLLQHFRENPMPEPSIGEMQSRIRQWAKLSTEEKDELFGRYVEAVDREEKQARITLARA